MKQKRAAIEMTTGTIIVIVLAVLMLVFGSIFVRNIMCAGIVMTDDITQMTQNEIKNIFGSAQTGVTCMGEGKNDITVSAADVVKVYCTFNVDKSAEYEMAVDKVESEGGVSTQTLQSWVGVEGGSWQISPGMTDAAKQKVVLTFKIPDPASIDTTSVYVQLTETNKETDTSYSHDLRFQMKPTGTVTAAIC